MINKYLERGRPPSLSFASLPNSWMPFAKAFCKGVNLSVLLLTLLDRGFGNNPPAIAVRHGTGVNTHTFRTSPDIYDCSLSNLLLTYKLDPGDALEPCHGPYLPIVYNLLGHRLWKMNMKILNLKLQKTRNESKYNQQAWATWANCFMSGSPSTSLPNATSRLGNKKKKKKYILKYSGPTQWHLHMPGL